MKKIGAGALLILAALTGNALANETFDPARSVRERIGGEAPQYERITPQQDYIDRFSGVSVPPGHSVMHQTRVDTTDIERVNDAHARKNTVGAHKRQARDYYAKVRNAD